MSSVDVLSPSVRPGSLPPGRRGRHIGRLPVILCLGVLVLVLVGLVYGAYSRSQHANARSADSHADPVPADPHALDDWLKQQPSGEIRPTWPKPSIDNAPAPPKPLQPVLHHPPPRVTTKSAEDRAYEEFLRKSVQDYAAALSSGLTPAGAQDFDSLYNTSAAKPGVPGSVAPGMSPPGLDIANALLRNAGGQNVPVDANGQSAKRAFLESVGEASPYLPHTRKGLATPYELKTGTVIPGVMITGINSDLPGQIIGQVSEPVFDTPTGQHLLIPQGTRVYGLYDASVTYGQQRSLVVWSRLIFPDGSTLELDAMGGQDRGGYAGFNDRVNNHYLRTFGQLLLVSVFKTLPVLATQTRSAESSDQLVEVVTITEEVIVGEADDGTPIKETITKEVPVTLSTSAASARGASDTAGKALQQEVSQQASDVGQALVQRNLGVQPTLQIRPGYRFHIMVNKDIAFDAPYEAYR